MLDRFPLISVIINVYKERLDWIREAVESILTQDYTNVELIIVVDNPHIDNSVQDYLDNLQNEDQRVKIIYNEINLGTGQSANVGISAASGEYIARLDADDISESNRFLVELEYIEMHDVDLVASLSIYIDEDGKEIGKSKMVHEDPNLMLPYENNIVHSSVLMKATVLRDVGGYRPLKSAVDADLWLRLLTNGNKMVILNNYLVRYRIRANGITQKGRLEQYYTGRYVHLLYEERIKYGKDSFSLENLNSYLQKKKISQRKNANCVRMMELYSEAKESFGENKIKGMWLCLRAFFVYPAQFIRIVHHSLKKRAFKKKIEAEVKS